MNQSDVLAQRDHLARELNISVWQVLVILATSTGLAVPVVWAFIRYWLFAP
jgi:hypothetical protein